MSKRTRTLMLLLALVLTVLLGACAQATPEPAPTEASQPEPAETQEEAMEEATEEPMEEATEEPMEEATEEMAQEEPLQVALLLFGPLADSGYNATAYEGLLEAEEELGIEGEALEILQVPDFEPAMRDYASRGFDLIIGHSTPFRDPALALADEFPETNFVIHTMFESDKDNVAFIYLRNVESHYIAGVLAANMSETGKIGFIGGVELPALVANLNAYIEGARAVNPDIVVSASFLGSFDDPVKGKETALAQIADGTDVILDSAAAAGLGVLEAAEENDVYVISYVDVRSDTAPPTLIASVLPDYSKLVRFDVELALAEEFDPALHLMNLENGVIRMVMTDLVPEDVQAQVLEAQQQIIDGTLVLEENFERTE